MNDVAKQMLAMGVLDGTWSAKTAEQILAPMFERIDVADALNVALRARVEHLEPLVASLTADAATAMRALANVSAERDAALAEIQRMERWRVETKAERDAARAQAAMLHDVLSQLLGDGHNLKAFANSLLNWGAPGVDMSDEAKHIVRSAEEWHGRISTALAATASDVVAYRAGIESAAWEAGKRSTNELTLAFIEGRAGYPSREIDEALARRLSTVESAARAKVRADERATLLKQWAGAATGVEALAEHDAQARAKVIEECAQWFEARASMKRNGQQVAVLLRLLLATPDTRAEDPHEQAFYRSGQTGVEPMPRPTVDAPAAKPETSGDDE